jgi:hypothetical protein
VFKLCEIGGTSVGSGLGVVLQPASCEDVFCARSPGHIDVLQKPKLCNYANITVLKTNDFPVGSSETVQRIIVSCSITLPRGERKQNLVLKPGDSVGNFGGR